VIIGLSLALALVGAVMFAIWWGKKSGMDAARASDFKSVRKKNAKINKEFSKMRKEHNEELDAIDSADAASQLRFIGRRRRKDS